MKYFSSIFFGFSLFFNYSATCQQLKNTAAKEPELVFDGSTFNGWEGDTVSTWRIEDNSIVGGSFKENVAHNYFLSTKKSYGDFILKLQFKLVCKDGFMNAGVQFRSERMIDPSYEMKGYQADLGPGYWASLYDESRRNKTLAAPDTILIKKLLKPDDWNEYEIRATKNKIEIFLNGVQTVRYTETDSTIPHHGLIALQIHGGGKTTVWYKHITITRLD